MDGATSAPFSCRLITSSSFGAMLLQALNSKAAAAEHKKNFFISLFY